MKKYFDPELEIVSFDVADRTNGFGGGDNEFPIDEFSENGDKFGIHW